MFLIFEIIHMIEAARYACAPHVQQYNVFEQSVFLEDAKTTNY